MLHCSLPYTLPWSCSTCHQRVPRASSLTMPRNPCGGTRRGRATEPVPSSFGACVRKRVLTPRASCLDSTRLLRACARDECCACVCVRSGRAR
eukprot:1868248-Pleurochrysis_carterae.AAC.1